MIFDINNVGKIVFLNKRAVESNLVTELKCSFIVGYDFVAKKYVGSDMCDYFNMCSKLPDGLDMYDLDSAVAYIDELLIRVDRARESLAMQYSNYLCVTRDVKRRNYQNELAHLSNAYWESINQLKFFQNYVKDADDSYRELYEHELKATEKAIRRLDKRFKFFFGEDAEAVKACIRESGCRNNMSSALRAFEYQIERLTKQKEHLKQRDNKVKKALGKN